jgi:hypothetical protein
MDVKTAIDTGDSQALRGLLRDDRSRADEIIQWGKCLTHPLGSPTTTDSVAESSRAARSLSKRPELTNHFTTIRSYRLPTTPIGSTVLTPQVSKPHCSTASIGFDANARSC